MNITERKLWPFQWFPQRRFDDSFPLAFWFAGLWFYLKSFLYFCYLYMIGLEPAPYSWPVTVEIVYFAATLIPALLMGLALWNEKRRAVIPGIAFLLIDTPVLIFHVLRLAEEGYLDSGLTKAFEFGGLVLNVIALGWLIAYRVGSAGTASRRK